jgi:hypothetical protein
VNIIKEEVRMLDTPKKPGGMIELKIEFRAGLSKGRTEQKRLPLSWTLSNLKNLFSKTMKVPVNVICNLNLGPKAQLYRETRCHLVAIKRRSQGLVIL